MFLGVPIAAWFPLSFAIKALYEAPMFSKTIRQSLLLWLVPGGLAVAGTLPPPDKLDAYLDSDGNFGLTFATHEMRRYILESSLDLATWDQWHFSPLVPQSGGVSRFSLVSPSRPKQFFRVSVLPWDFQPVVRTNNWLGDVSLAMTPQGNLLIVYQDRDANELRLIERTPDGLLSSPSLVATTGMIDEPDFWDNSGYSDVTLQLSADGTRFIVCRDQVAESLVCFWKRQEDAQWQRHEVTGPLWRWPYPRFNISPDGTLGVLYHDAGDAFLTWAASSAPTQWETLKVKENESSRTGFIFNAAGDALLEFPHGADLKVNLRTKAISEAWFPGCLQSIRSAGGRLVALSGTGDDGIRVYRSQDGGDTWQDSWVPLALFTRAESGSAAFRSDEEISLVIGASDGVQFFAPQGGGAAKSWKSTRISALGTWDRGPLVHLANGKAAVILLRDDYGMILGTED